MQRFLIPRIRDCVFLIIFAGALALGSRMLNTDGDLGRDLTLGKFILDAHPIPTLDLFSFTRAGQPRPPYEWLAQLGFALAYRVLNLDGVVLLTAMILGLTFAFLYNAISSQTRMPLLSLLITLWAAAASSVHWLTRPHIFSFLFLAVWISGLEQLRAGRRQFLWLFPLVMLFWANTHGGFIFGFLALAAYLAGWLVDYWRKAASAAAGRDLLIAGIGSSLASVITPDFWHNWQAVFGNSSAYVLSHTAETMPPDLSEGAILPFTGLLVLSGILALWQWKRASASHFFLLAGLGAMSLLMARNIPLFAIAAAFIVAEWTGERIVSISFWMRLEQAFRKIEGALVGLALPLIAVLAVAGYFAYYAATLRSSFYEFSPQVFPVQASDWIQSQPPHGNMFNDLNWGGYLLYRLWPGQRVFVDSQTDFYGEAFLRGYSSILSGADGWEAALDEYRVDWIIVPRGAALAEAAGHSSEWQMVYEDPLTIIFERK